jgi:hypothetical protein
MNTPYFAEIIESSLHRWRAQSWQWDTFPSFGSLLTIETDQRTLFGIVHQIETGSRDTLHIPMAHQKTEQELRAEYPHIFSFLQTTFICLPLGYKEHDTLWYQLPPQPPKIHAFLRHPSVEEQELFFSNEQYLHLLFSLSSCITNIDELLFALLTQAYKKTMFTQERWHNFINLFSLLTGNDYRRLKLFLQRAQSLITLPTH